MSQDLTQQWLTEIQSLKQQIAELQNDRNTAWESAEKWRKLYNTEAEQRRTDAQLAQQAIASLKLEIQNLQGIDGVTLADATAATAIQEEVVQINSLEELKTKLITVTKERDRLLQALKTEQDHHAQTRKSLTTALGDAIDSWTRERDGERGTGSREQGE
jgi:DNA-binding helix-hairpin-helix protein with protein kinase domain